MKVFVIWSGDLSYAVATTIREEFEKVLQHLPVFMSTDIQAGMPWFETIRQNLVESDVGIIVITQQNQRQPWLYFEAGAIAAKAGKPHVISLLVDLAYTDLGGPLAHYQAIAGLGHDDMRKLLALLNSLREKEALKDATFDSTFEKWWPDLERRFNEAKKIGGPVGAPAKRPPEELIADVLTEVRALSRQSELQTSLIMRTAATTAMQVAEQARLGFAAGIGATGYSGYSGHSGLGTPNVLLEQPDILKAVGLTGAGPGGPLPLRILSGDHSPDAAAHMAAQVAAERARQAIVQPGDKPDEK